MTQLPDFSTKPRVLLVYTKLKKQELRLTKVSYYSGGFRWMVRLCVPIYIEPLLGYVVIILSILRIDDSSMCAFVCLGVCVCVDI